MHQPIQHNSRSNTNADSTPDTTPTPDPVPDELLNSIISGSLGPLARLQDTINQTLDQAGNWIADPANRQQLANLITLLDAQTQLVVSQQRLVAVARLVDVAANAPGYETTRRACADLLRVRLIDPYLEDRRPTPPPSMIPPENADDIRAALEELAAADYLHTYGRPQPKDEVEPWARNAMDDAVREAEEAELAAGADPADAQDPPDEDDVDPADETEPPAPPCARSDMSNGARRGADGAPDGGGGADSKSSPALTGREDASRAAARRQLTPPDSGRARHRTYL